MNSTRISVITKVFREVAKDKDSLNVVVRQLTNILKFHPQLLGKEVEDFNSIVSSPKDNSEMYTVEVWTQL